MSLSTKTIKYDASSFPTLKNQNQWDDFNRKLVATARAQELSEVLDVKYSPKTDEKDLFDKKKSFIYSVFVSTLLIDQGKKFVREYEDDYDAHRIYKKLLTHAKESTKASIDSSNILSYITSARIDDGTWRGTTVAFILHWQEQIRLYESLVNVNDHFSAGQKRVMLENAVFPLNTFLSVKDTADQIKVK